MRILLFLAQDFKQSGDIYKSLISDTSHDALHLNRLAYTELMSKNYKAAEAASEQGTGFSSVTSH